MLVSLISRGSASLPFFPGWRVPCSIIPRRGFGPLHLSDRGIRPPGPPSTALAAASRVIPGVGGLTRIRTEGPWFAATRLSPLGYETWSGREDSNLRSPASKAGGDDLAPLHPVGPSLPLSAFPPIAVALRTPACNPASVGVVRAAWARPPTPRSPSTCAALRLLAAPTSQATPSCRPFHARWCVGHGSSSLFPLVSPGHRSRRPGLLGPGVNAWPEFPRRHRFRTAAVSRPGLQIS